MLKQSLGVSQSDLGFGPRGPVAVTPGVTRQSNHFRLIVLLHCNSFGNIRFGHLQVLWPAAAYGHQVIGDNAAP